ncbi:MAG: hypothetical protein FWC43_07890 [Planctomycetaceae bacterium]|nr:hypothetical protein [Planctomycetaceae bacterium]
MPKRSTAAMPAQRKAMNIGAASRAKIAASKAAEKASRGKKKGGKGRG